MDKLFYTGKILYALTIAFFGIGHLTDANGMATMIPAAFQSVAIPVVFVTGICLIAAAVSFIMNKWSRIAGILLAVFLILVVLTVHVPGLPDQVSMSMVVKDLAIAGAALMVAGASKSKIQR